MQISLHSIGGVIHMISRKNLTLYVDWNAQISNAGQKNEGRIERQIEKTFLYVIGSVSNALSMFSDVDLFNISVRVYYGWISGTTKTKSRRVIEEFIRDRELPFVSVNLNFDWSNVFGDAMMCASEHRRHPRLKIHLPDTLRTDLKDGNKKREKMVDSALICDLLHSARSFPADWRVVMGEDDDLVPGIYTSEFWSKNSGGRNYILRCRKDFGHLQLNGLLLGMEERHVG